MTPFAPDSPAVVSKMVAAWAAGAASTKAVAAIEKLFVIILRMLAVK